MLILAVILIVTGMVLLIVGRNVVKYLPPNVQTEDEGFLQLLQTMENLVRAAGFVLLFLGAICLLIFLL